MSIQNPDDGFGYNALVEEMRAGYRDAHGILRDHVDKAKANITAGTMVLGIIIAGARVSSGLLGQAGHDLSAPLIPSLGIPLVPTLMGMGMGAIVLSIAVSVGAIAAIRLEKPFGSRTVLTEGELDHAKFKAWGRVPKEAICAKICDAYGKATLQRERQARRSGKATAIGQISLVVGPVLAAAPAFALAAPGSSLARAAGVAPPGLSWRQPSGSPHAPGAPRAARGRQPLKKGP